MYTPSARRPIFPVLDAMTDTEFLGFLRRYAAKTTASADGHLLWTGAVNNTGYGLIWLGSGLSLAHRVAWVLAHGRDPHPNLTIDHECRITNCVSAPHLAEVTTAENILRGTGPSALNAAKIFCDRGHLFAGHNLIVNSRGHRICRACRDFRNRQYYARQHPVPRRTGTASR